MNCEELSSNKDNGSKACGLHCIRINNINVKSGHAVLVENINMHIHCGRLTALIGPNGAGKTTLIKAILGEIHHTGIIEFRDMRNKEVKDLRIGYVPQYLNIDKNNPISVYDMFACYISSVPVFFKKKKTLEQQIINQLQLFGAGDLINKQAGGLSGGELQRVMLAIACTPVPDLLLLDEPVSGVDKNGMQLFYNHIDMLKKQYDMSILLISHDFDFVEKYADYAILMNRTIIKEGSPDQVINSNEFKALFNHLNNNQ